MSSARYTQYDCIIIGGGFFGAYIALQASHTYKKIAIIEQENDLLTHASINNQARVHNGYHYPRSLSTAISSAKHFSRFCKEFASSIDDTFEKYYGIARIGTKTSSTQFYRLFKQCGMYIEPAPKHIQALCDKELISDVFCVQEYAFNACILRDMLKDRLESSGVEILYNTQVLRVQNSSNREAQHKPPHITNSVALIIDSTNTDSTHNTTSNTPPHYMFNHALDSTLSNSNQPESNHPNQTHHASTNIREFQTLYAPLVLNCTYAGINTLLFNSHLPLLPLKYELTEMALVRVPKALEHCSFTIMDGAFFSLMPYPARDCYTLSHVRYTPHCAWQDMIRNTPTTSSQRPANITYPYHLLHEFLSAPKSKYPLMLADCKRYMPLLESLEYIDSLYEIKTLQIKNEIDDGRPIIFAKDYGIKGFCVIMGGKIDNIYEITQCLQECGILKHTN